MASIKTKPIFKSLSPSLHSDEFRHYLRALLREASYLPDSLARKFHKTNILARFRKYNTPERKKNPPRQLWSRVPVLLRSCKQELFRLERANLGYRHDLIRAMLQAYGRIGYLREKQVQLLMSSEFSGGEEGRPDLISRTVAKHTHAQHVEKGLPKITPATEVIMLAQRHVKPQSLDNRSMGHPDIKGPVKLLGKNVWDRPIPIKRVNNIVRDYYGTQKRKILPPPPQWQWERLSQFASGQEPCPAPIPRRTPARQIFGSNSAEDPLSLTSISRQTPPGKEHPHAFTRRFRQRIYLGILEMSPKIQRIAGTGDWQIHWPRRRSPFAKKEAGLREWNLRHVQPRRKVGDSKSTKPSTASILHQSYDHTISLASKMSVNPESII